MTKTSYISGNVNQFEGLILLGLHGEYKWKDMSWSFDQLTKCASRFVVPHMPLREVYAFHSCSNRKSLCNVYWGNFVDAQSKTKKRVFVKVFSIPMAVTSSFYFEL
jgi:hypothetical protein